MINSSRRIIQRMRHIFSMYRFTKFVYKSTRHAEKVVGDSHRMMETGEILRPTPYVVLLVKDYASKRGMSEHEIDDIGAWCEANDFLTIDKSDKTIRITAKGRDFISWFLIIPVGVLQVIFTKFSFLAGGTFTALVVFIWHIIRT